MFLISKLQVKGYVLLGNLCILEVFAPTEKNGYINKDQSCQFMGTAYDSTPNDTVIGDLNVKLG
jgi:hypothetical protein